MLNAATIKLVRKICQIHSESKPAEVCALLDHKQSITGTNEGAPDNVLDALKELSPKPIYVASEWRWASSLPFDFTDAEKVLLSCAYGLMSVKARDYIFGQAAVLQNPKQWLPALRQLHESVETQIEFFVAQVMSVRKNIGPREDVVAAIVAKDKGLKGKILSGIPEVVKIHEAAKKYEALISDQIKEELTGAKAVFS